MHADFGLHSPSLVHYLDFQRLMVLSLFLLHFFSPSLLLLFDNDLYFIMSHFQNLASLRTFCIVFYII